MFTIAIIGRPNVGKSTLFNRLAGKGLAIVDDLPGVTRDRRDAFGNLGPMEFRIIDTAGLESDLTDLQLETRMVEQTKQATLDADLCLFVVDGKAGIIPADIHFANWLRNSGKPAVLVANKCEGKNEEFFGREYYKLGLGQAVGVSAEHKEGFNFLYDAIEPFYDQYQKDFGTYEQQARAPEDKRVQIAVIGRPNAGKSTFLNSLIGNERLITGPEAGITRDAISIDWQFEDYQIRLIDTAGIRKKSNINKKLEELSVLDSFRAIRFAQVVIMLIDATSIDPKQDIIDHQDLSIAAMVIKEGRGLVFALNKFDLIANKDEVLKEARLSLAKTLHDIAGAPIVPICAINGHNVAKTLKQAIKVYQQWQIHIPTSKLNDWLRKAESDHPPILVKGQQVKLKYITQAKRRPPTFVLFTNHPKAITHSYQRYLTNSLKEHFDLSLILIRLIVKKSDNPFEGRKEKTFSKKRETGTKRLS